MATMAASPNWWIVLLPGEYAETSDIYGPFRSEPAAQDVADRWNATHSDDQASVLPVSPAKELATAKGA